MNRIQAVLMLVLPVSFWKPTFPKGKGVGLYGADPGLFATNISSVRYSTAVVLLDGTSAILARVTRHAAGHSFTTTANW
jgi:hypothetical protein